MQIILQEHNQTSYHHMSRSCLVISRQICSASCPFGLLDLCCRHGCQSQIALCQSPATLIFVQVAWGRSKSLESSLHMTGKWQEQFKISAEDKVTQKIQKSVYSLCTVLPPGEDERPLVFWVSPETKSVLQEVLKWILATITAVDQT